MSSRELQACLARIYTDDAFRQLSRLDLAVTVDRYELTPKERDAVLRLDARLVDFFAASLRKKRRARFAAAYPSFFRLDEKRANRLWERYCALLGCNPYQSQEALVQEFGQFLLESVRDDPSWPSFAADLIRFEAVTCELGAELEHGGQEPDDGRRDDGNAEPAAPVTAEMRFIRAPAVALLTFDYDVLDLISALRADGQIPQPAPRTTCIAVRDPHGSAAGCFAISEPAYRVLVWCDGTLATGALATRIEDLYGVSDLFDTVAALLGQLRRLRLINQIVPVNVARSTT